MIDSEIWQPKADIEFGTLVPEWATDNFVVHAIDGDSADITDFYGMWRTVPVSTLHEIAERVEPVDGALVENPEGVEYRVIMQTKHGDAFLTTNDWAWRWCGSIPFSKFKFTGQF